MQGADDMQVTCEVDGIPVVVDRSKLSDFDTLEMFYDLQQMAASFEDGDGDDAAAMMVVVPFARTLFGTSQWRNIKQTLREDGGDIPHMFKCIKFIFNALEAASAASGGDLKN